ncbi:hypothetical protein HYT23_06470 [Candidatus Pacearchaeota archaeon]|nr:hypothetical protein [Candidatus Pacearchaeota archaeon]
MHDKKIDWKECCSKKTAKSITPDLNLIESLKKSSENKLKSSDELQMNETTSVSKFILAYDSLREALEALASKKGYKIYNHECYTAFLKEVLNQSNLGDEFDEIRKVRNSVNYYGKELSVEDSSGLILKTKKLKEQILQILKE